MISSSLGGRSGLMRSTRVGGLFRIASKTVAEVDRKSTRLNSSHGYISYAVFSLTKKRPQTHTRRRPPHRRQVRGRGELHDALLPLLRPTPRETAAKAAPTTSASRMPYTGYPYSL